MRRRALGRDCTFLVLPSLEKNQCNTSNCSKLFHFDLEITSMCLKLIIITFSARELIFYFTFLQGTYFQVKHPLCGVEFLSQPKHRNQRERIPRGKRIKKAIVSNFNSQCIQGHELLTDVGLPRQTRTYEPNQQLRNI